MYMMCFPLFGSIARGLIRVEGPVIFSGFGPARRPPLSFMALCALPVGGPSFLVPGTALTLRRCPPKLKANKKET